MKTLLIGTFSLILVTLLVTTALVAQQPGQPAAGQGLRIVVVSGEDSVNIIQQKTAVGAVVEVRDRNDLPVAGATVQFSIGQAGGAGGSAVFANGQSALTVVTDGTGRAAVSQLQTTTAGALRINVQASFQGQVGTATITQTNVATAAEAAKLANNPGQAAAAGGGAAAQGGSVVGTIAAIGAAAVTIATAVVESQETPSCQAFGDRALAAITALQICPASSPQCTQAASDATRFLGEWCSCAGGRSQLEVETRLRGSSVAELERESALRGIQFPAACR